MKLKVALNKFISRQVLVGSCAFFLGITSPEDANCQEHMAYLKNDYYSNATPKTPGAASLGTFGSMPINGFIGLPEVSLNLFTLSSRDLSVPVSIGYDASGIRTNDISGEVGIKWNLSAGGSVQRNLVGRPDEEPANGYWKHADLTNYYTNFSPHLTEHWIAWAERNEVDRGPDEFVINIPGRSIKFVFDKYKAPIPIPRQNIRLSYSMSSNKIHSFTLITEDGVRYDFGGVTSAIEETKIERINVKFKFGDGIPDRYDQDCGTASLLKPNVPLSNYVTESIETVANYSSFLIDFFNSKWNLVSITSPTGDFINFTYDKSGTTVVSQTPVATKVQPHQVQVWNATNYCDFEPLVAIAKFTSSSGPNFPLIQNQIVPATSTGLYFEPNYKAANPGQVIVAHTLVTTKPSIIASIVTSAGSSALFFDGVRQDLPGGKRINYINQFASDNRFIRKIQFNYLDVSASTESDACWISEGAMLAGSPNLPASGVLNAYQIRSTFTPSSIQHPDLRKFVYEGIKEHNYLRLFLESVEEVNLQSSKKLFEFTYNNRHLLLRRGTPKHDLYGYSRDSHNEGVGNSLKLNPSGQTTAFVCNGYYPNANLENLRDPLRGILTSIKYPTGGATEFEYFEVTPSVKGPRLKKLIDEDGQGGEVVREMKYPSAAYSSPPVVESYLEYTVKVDPFEYFLNRVTSSSPQNDSYTLHNGSVDCFASAKILNGSDEDHKGFEVYYYKYEQNVSTAIQTLNLWGTEHEVFPFPRGQEKEHLQGLISEHRVYSGDVNVLATQRMLKQTIIEHVANPYGYAPPSIYGFKSGQYVHYSGSSYSVWVGWEEEPFWRYKYARYLIQPDWVVQKKVTERIYNPTGPTNDYTEIVKEFDYDLTTQLVNQVKNYNSLDPANKVTEKTKYVTDYPQNSCTTTYFSCVSGCAFNSQCISTCTSTLSTCLSTVNDGNAIKLLAAKGQINSPVEVQNWVGDGMLEKLTSVRLYRYRRQTPNSFVKPTEIWGLDRTLIGIGTGHGQYAEAYIDIGTSQLVLDPKLRKLHSFNAYDSYGNITQQTLGNGIVSSFVWGHNGSLLLSETVNPSGSTPLQTSYVHKPGAGPSSITDPNLRVKRFEYDAFDRLRLERDHDNAIQKRYRYYYASQPEGFTNNSIWNGCALAGQPLDLSSSEPAFLGVTNTFWTFGDGTSASSATGTVNKTYASPGTYEVTCRKENPEFFSKEISKSLNVYSPITSFNLSVSGPSSYDVCNINNPVTGLSSLELQITGDAFNIQWTECFEGSCWTSPYGGVPGGFGSPGIVGSWTITVTATDACGNVYSSSTGFHNYASNPMCEFY